MENPVKELILQAIKNLVDIKSEMLELTKAIKEFCKTTNNEITFKQLNTVADSIIKGVITYEEFCETYEKEYTKLRKQELN